MALAIKMLWLRAKIVPTFTKDFLDAVFGKAELPHDLPFAYQTAAVGFGWGRV